MIDWLESDSKWKTDPWLTNNNYSQKPDPLCALWVRWWPSEWQALFIWLDYHSTNCITLQWHPVNEYSWSVSINFDISMLSSRLFSLLMNWQKSLMDTQWVSMNSKKSVCYEVWRVLCRSESVTLFYYSCPMMSFHSNIGFHLFLIEEWMETWKNEFLNGQTVDKPTSIKKFYDKVKKPAAVDIEESVNHK